MTTNKLKNWRDERGSELERAKKLIKERPIKLIELSEWLDIPYQTLKNLSHNLDKVDRMNWQDVNKLSQAYDILEIQAGMTQTDVYTTQAEVSKRLDMWADDDFTKKVRQILTSDPVIIYELFKTLKK